MLNVVQLLNTRPTLEQLASAANKSVMFDGMCVIEKSESMLMVPEIEPTTLAENPRGSNQN